MNANEIRSFWEDIYINYFGMTPDFSDLEIPEEYCTNVDLIAAEAVQMDVEHFYENLIVTIASSVFHF